jgi:hypothetical protein
VTKDGKIYSWGNNNFGQLGLGHTTQQNTPQLVTAITDKIISISCGYAHVMALTDKGDVYIWGNNEYGQLGLGTYIQQNTPIKLDLPSKTRDVACGGSFGVALSVDGYVHVFGINGAGQLGIGDPDEKVPIPKKLEVPGEKIIGVTCGYHHTIVVTESEKIYGWGANGAGQLGLGDYAHRSTPQLIKLPDDMKKMASLACGGFHSMAFDISGDIFVWGYNEFGQLGLGDGNKRNNPTLLPRSFIPKKINQEPPKPRVTLRSLLESGLYSDVTVYKKRLHKAVLRARCPGEDFLNFDFSPFPKAAVLAVIDWIYTNTTVQFSVLKMEELCDAVSLTRALGIRGLQSVCQKYLVDGLLTENAFSALHRCVQLNLTKEIEWILWYIGKNKVVPPPEMLSKFTALSPQTFMRAFAEAANLTLPPPHIQFSPMPMIEDDLEKLFLSEEYSDFNLLVNGTPMLLHKCLLASWDFAKILFHDATHTAQMPLDTFRKILRFFYTRKLDTISFVDAGWILAFVDYYLLSGTELAVHCESLTSGQLTPSTWMDAYILGFQLKDSELQRKAMLSAGSTCSTDEAVKALDTVLVENEELKNQLRTLLQELEDLKGAK